MKRIKWTPEKYRAIVGGDETFKIPSLRSIAEGFESKDGFNLREVGEWSASQRRKVREMFKRINLLQAQPKRIVRARGENLKSLQDAFHGTVPSKNLKVVFVPDTEPALTEKGVKSKPPRIRFLKEGISLQRRTHERIFIPFNKKSLARDAKAEVKRVAAQMPDAVLFYIRTGEYDSIHNGSVNIVADQVVRWMAQYDGVTPIPKGSGNYGDDPKHHRWQRWLDGLVGYHLPKVSGRDIRKMQAIIREGRKENERLRDERRRFMQRIGRKPKQQ